MGLRNFHKPGASPTPKKRVVSLTHLLPEEELGSWHSSYGLFLLDLQMSSLSLGAGEGNLVLVLGLPTLVTMTTLEEHRPSIHHFSLLLQALQGR